MQPRAIILHTFIAQHPLHPETEPPLHNSSLLQPFILPSVPTPLYRLNTPPSPPLFSSSSFPKSYIQTTALHGLSRTSPGLLAKSRHGPGIITLQHKIQPLFPSFWDIYCFGSLCKTQQLWKYIATSTRPLVQKETNSKRWLMTKGPPCDLRTFQSQTIVIILRRNRKESGRLVNATMYMICELKERHAA